VVNEPECEGQVPGRRLVGIRNEVDVTDELRVLAVYGDTRTQT
jgi:hypothetical protein